MDHYSYLSNTEPAAIDELYANYLKDPNAVDPSWGRFFEGVRFAGEKFPVKPDILNGSVAIPENVTREFKVINLINGYRSRGHLFTKTNPVRERRQYMPTMAIENFGLESTDLNTVFQAGTITGIGPATLQAIIQQLEETYCQSIGVEYMYIRNQEMVQWLQHKMESTRGRSLYSVDEKKQIFRKLNDAVGFESFLDKKFVGQKRFSLEGCEALIPALHYIIEHGANLGIREFVMGMAHRGRLSVLANIFKKDPARIFTEFEGKMYDEGEEFSGDVKYHLGYSARLKTGNGHEVGMTLTPNPSHLEAVGPVAEGVARAFADSDHDNDYNRIAPVIIHGDAAIAGQGVVYELVQMAKLDGYKTGGSVHIVVNNQVGFTTNYTDGRSSIYCTDVAKVTLSPVFHVNADDVEAVVFTIQLAMEFRQKFHGDVFIDLLGYRKYGHNEGDEPRFTQPILYKAIAKHPNPRQIYLERLINEGAISLSDAEKFDSELKEKLEKALEIAKKQETSIINNFLENSWKKIRHSTPKDFESSPKTGVSKAKLLEVAKALYSIPSGMKFFKKMEKLLNDRKAMIEKTDQLDWGMAELLAYGTLLQEGNPIRFSGQDVERGTFSHRHAVLKLEDSEEEYIPLNTISKDQAGFQIYNSLLSEYAVLGFDYGYSLALPNSLTIWEAQFGDFNNGAQIIIDQFISSAEDKWRSMSGLVMLLPHGFEGQGAEHSSGRMERFLALCAEQNMYVTNITTPANFFHALRRQLRQDIRKPLIVFTPKSLLRSPRCLSALSELETGCFQELMDDQTAKPANVVKLVFCTGKLFYELIEEREIQKNESIAIIRIEQLYPFPQQAFDKLIKKYSRAKDLIWAQEEPENMGAWAYLLRTQRNNYSFKLYSRAESGSPATGSSKRHAAEQARLVKNVISDSPTH